MTLHMTKPKAFRIPGSKIHAVAGMPHGERSASAAFGARF
jgi:hypothetical protein